MGLLAATASENDAVYGDDVYFVCQDVYKRQKEKIIQLGVPAIVARGRKGGSNIAAAIVNAIQYGMPSL